MAALDAYDILWSEPNFAICLQILFVYTRSRMKIRHLYVALLCSVLLTASLNAQSPSLTASVNLSNSDGTSCIKAGTGSVGPIQALCKDILFPGPLLGDGRMIANYNLLQMYTRILAGSTGGPEPGPDSPMETVATGFQDYLTVSMAGSGFLKMTIIVSGVVVSLGSASQHSELSVTSSQGQTETCSATPPLGNCNLTIPVTCGSATGVALTLGGTLEDGNTESSPAPINAQQLYAKISKIQVLDASMNIIASAPLISASGTIYPQ